VNLKATASKTLVANHDSVGILDATLNLPQQDDHLKKVRTQKGYATVKDLDYGPAASYMLTNIRFIMSLDDVVASMGGTTIQMTNSQQSLLDHPEVFPFPNTGSWSTRGHPQFLTHAQMRFAVQFMVAAGKILTVPPHPFWDATLVQFVQLPDYTLPGTAPWEQSGWPA
jgi:hypothetical protein